MFKLLLGMAKKKEDSLEAIRHSLAHLLAAAVLKKFPRAKLGIGPAVADGFYYDILFPRSLEEKDLVELEALMREYIKAELPFSGKKVTPAQAKKLFANQPFKLELIEDFKKAKLELTAYATGDIFVDLCKGGHVKNTREIPIDGFQLQKIAGAYWKGDEKNKMLTRVYGLAFLSKKELEEHLAMLKEAEKRDHRKLGKELGIFAFDDDTGPGLPLWLPKGTIIIEELEALAKQTEKDAGYAQVRTPHIAKESMYRTSGHLPYYKESMFPPMEYEGGKYYLKAMNCPHHHKIFGALPRSYRELPVRLAEYGTVYRHEKSGELFGLMRVRMLSMNDAHIYCTEEQFADEFRAVNDMYLKYFKIFGIEKYVMRFSTHDPKKLGEKYVNEPKLWKKTETMVRKVLVDSKIPFVEIPNEAAFYGPKIDVQVWSAIGREFTLATNQVDFAVPERFGLTYTDEKGKQKTPLCIHRAPLGTHERFVGFLIEHYAGAFPLWLAPIQARVVPVSAGQTEYGKEVFEILKTMGIRVELDDSGETLGKRVRGAEVEKIPYILVVGEKEKEAKTVSVRTYAKGQLGTMSVSELQTKLGKEIAERSI